jgi:hypothetical protein
MAVSRKPGYGCHHETEEHLMDMPAQWIKSTRERCSGRKADDPQGQGDDRPQGSREKELAAEHLHHSTDARAESVCITVAPCTSGVEPVFLVTLSQTVVPVWPRSGMPLASKRNLWLIVATALQSATAGHPIKQQRHGKRP